MGATMLTSKEWEDKVLEELHAMRLVMERQNTILEAYMERTEKLETRLDPVERHVLVVNTIVKGVMSLGVVGVVAKMLHDAYMKWVA
jgi:hypothetical protein